MISCSEVLPCLVSEEEVVGSCDEGKSCSYTECSVVVSRDIGGEGSGTDSGIEVSSGVLLEGEVSECSIELSEGVLLEYSRTITGILFPCSSRFTGKEVRDISSTEYRCMVFSDGCVYEGGYGFSEVSTDGDTILCIEWSVVVESCDGCE